MVGSCGPNTTLKTCGEKIKFGPHLLVKHLLFIIYILKTCGEKIKFGPHLAGPQK